MYVFSSIGIFHSDIVKGNGQRVFRIGKGMAHMRLDDEKIPLRRAQFFYFSILFQPHIYLAVDDEKGLSVAGMVMVASEGALTAFADIDLLPAVSAKLNKRTALVRMAKIRFNERYHVLLPVLHQFHVVANHELDQLLEGGLGGVPAQLALGFGRVAPQVHHVGGAVELGRNFHQNAAGSLVDALFGFAFATEFQLDTGLAEGQFAEFAHGMLIAGGDDEILRLVLLEYEPHAFHVILGVAPVAQGGEVAEVELVLPALSDAGGGKGYLAGHEGLASAFGFVVEQDAGTAVHAVGFAVFPGYPEAVLLGHGVGRVGMEGGVLVLRAFLHLAVEFGGRGLIDAAGLFEAAEAHGLEDAQNAHGVHVGSVFGSVEAYLHMALRGEVVQLVRLHHAHHAHEAHGVRKVAIVEMEARVAFKVVDAFALFGSGTAYHAMHVVAFFKKEFGKIRAVLPSNASDESGFHDFSFSRRCFPISKFVRSPKRKSNSCVSK